LLTDKLVAFGDRLKWARGELRLKVNEAVIPTLNAAGIHVSANRWYEWEKIGTAKDARARKAQQKIDEKARKKQAIKDGQPYTPKRQVAYSPPWPDELDAIEHTLGIRAQWLITGKGTPFAHKQNQRATDIDPLFARLSDLYDTLTEGQKRAINTLLESFNPSDRQP
jgi:hypothetical protein